MKREKSPVTVSPAEEVRERAYAEILKRYGLKLPTENRKQNPDKSLRRMEEAKYPSQKSRRERA